MVNPFERQENPEVKEAFSMLYHHLSHFSLLSGAGTYNAKRLEKSKEFIDKILQISQNESLASVLGEIKSILDGIDTNSESDTTVLRRISELKDTASIERKY